MLGVRLRQARLSAGFSLDDVVERLQQHGLLISKQGISHYERDVRTPRPSVIILLAKVLGVKQSFLLSESDYHIEWAAYRSQTKLGKTKRSQIEAKAEGLVESHLTLQSLLYPRFEHAFPKPVRINSPEAAERAAIQLRNTWNLGFAPVDSAIRTVEDHGGVVVPYPMQGVRFDGLSGRVNGKSPVIVVNTSVPHDRLRFDLAHEIGHLVMDCRALTAKEEESLAHRFAGAFLVPDSAVIRELGRKRSTLSARELALLKMKYGMSMQAWVRRAYDLGIISKRTYQNTWMHFSRMGWRRSEPVNYIGDEEPEKLKQYVLHALAEDLITPDEAEKLVPGSTNDISETELVKALSAVELMKLPPAEREPILEKTAKDAAKEYMNNPELLAFESLIGDGIDE